MQTFDVYWSPEGRKIATVVARNERAAVRKAPKPYRKYPGELYAVRVPGELGTSGSAPSGAQTGAQGA